jgi:hypothetical protein
MHAPLRRSLSLAWASLLLTLAASGQKPTPSTAPAPSPAASASAAPADTKAEARQRFERGLALFEQGELDAALAEFLRSRELYPTKSAAINAARVLQKLKRYHEAQEKLEALLAETSQLKDEERTTINQIITELRPRVATLDIRVSEAGATVLINGEIRGLTPVGPLRVNAGSHLLRVVKEGYVTLEQRVDAAGDTVNPIEVKLVPIARGGKARISESNGAAVEVLIDGVLVGKTPWEGTLPEGRHVVLLRGEGDLGTAPASFDVRLDDTTALSLTLARLACPVSIEPTPITARIAIDGIDVERGAWRGRLACGPHRIEIAAEGFFPQSRVENLFEGKPTELSVSLERDLSSSLWRAAFPSRIVVGLRATGGLLPSLGGDVAGCNDCSPGLALAGSLQLELGYRLGSGLGFYLEGGYLSAAQTLQDRQESLTPVGLPAHPGRADDTLSLRGLSLGAALGYQRGSSWQFGGRLAFGLWLASLSDRRTFDAPARSPSPAVAYQAGPVTSSGDALFLRIEPMLQLGRALGEHWRVSAGAGLQMLAALSKPTWEPLQVQAGRCPDPDVNVCAGRALFPQATLVGGFLLLPQLTLSLQRDF